MAGLLIATPFRVWVDKRSIKKTERASCCARECVNDVTLFWNYVKVMNACGSTFAWI